MDESLSPSAALANMQQRIKERNEAANKFIQALNSFFEQHIFPAYRAAIQAIIDWWKRVGLYFRQVGLVQRRRRFQHIRKDRLPLRADWRIVKPFRPYIVRARLN